MPQAKYVRQKRNLKLEIFKLGVFHSSKFQRRLQEGLFIATLALSSFLWISLASYHATDSSWSCTGSSAKVANAGGYVGAWVSDILLCAFGYVAYILPLLLLFAAWMAWRQRFSDIESKHLFLWRAFGFLLILLSSSSLLDLHFAGAALPFGAGGVLGNIFHVGMIKIFNEIGANLILAALLLAAITVFSGLSWLKVLRLSGIGLIKSLDFLGALVLNLKRRDGDAEGDDCADGDVGDDEEDGAAIARRNKNLAFASALANDGKESAAKSCLEVSALKGSGSSDSMSTISEARKKLAIIKPSAIKTGLRAEKERQMLLFDDYDVEGAFPSLSLLDGKDNVSGNNYTQQQLEERSRVVELKLKDFGIDAEVVAVHPGPVVTRFELQLAAGTKVNRITTLAKDLARSLSVISVRVVEVIPGKSVIGLELPNSKREVVRLREVLSAEQYEQTKAALALALGKGISGLPIVVDLARMPHLLVAGTTGSGKSVCLNALLLSLLYKYTPRELRLILIDPKMLELSVYDRIPHLLVPVVTNMKEAANALRWCVGEMERRYKLMMSLGVRNIGGYNHKIKDARNKGKPLLDPLWQENQANDVGNVMTESDDDEARGSEGPPELQELPYVTVIADEYADMIMVVGKRVEELIARIAQKARAAGIHLILATQRPSVDVITGLIKANIPARIAFQVSSKIDSRTILDQSGAEQLLGYGDMLYLPPGSGIPTRVHGAFVADEEVHRVVHDWQRRGAPEYIDEILEGGGDANGGAGGNGWLDGVNGGSGDAFEGDEKDAFYDQAVYFVTETRRVSISSIQRRFKIGYNRAARIVETMEAAGVVSAMGNNGSREVLAPPPVQKTDDR